MGALMLDTLAARKAQESHLESLATKGDIDLVRKDLELLRRDIIIQLGSLIIGIAGLMIAYLELRG